MSTIESLWYGDIWFPTLLSPFTSFTHQDAEEENPQDVQPIPIIVKHLFLVNWSDIEGMDKIYWKSEKPIWRISTLYNIGMKFITTQAAQVSSSNKRVRIRGGTPLTDEIRKKVLGTLPNKDYILWDGGENYAYPFCLQKLHSCARGARGGLFRIGLFSRAKLR